MSDALADLRAKTDETLIAEHDSLAKHTSVGVDFYLQELRHRDLARSSTASEALARQAYVLTIVNTVLASIAAIAAVVALVH